MSIPGSTVDTVKDYLVAAITSQINDTSVLVTYDLPGAFQPEDIVMVGDISVSNAVHAFVGSGGQHWLQETYEVDVMIRVYRGGDDAPTVFKRAKALSDAVDSVVRTDPSCGGVVQLAYPSSTSYQNEWEEKHLGRQTVVTKKITVQADI